MIRHRLTDEQWTVVCPLIPVSTAPTDRPARNPREMLDGILWILVTGAAWRDLPQDFGPWETVYCYFARWQRTGVFENIFTALQVKLDEAGKLDWSAWCVDGTSIRASRAAGGAGKKSLDSHELEPADHALGYSKGGFGTKVHIVTDARGLPLAAELTAGQTHESTQAESVIAWALTYQSRDGEDLRVPQKLLGDKGYSAERVREWLIDCGIEPVIARKSNEHKREAESFDAETYRKRNAIERCVGWLKECRRFATRFEKLAVRFAAMVQLAMIRRYLHVGFSNSA